MSELRLVNAGLAAQAAVLPRIRVDFELEGDAFVASFHVTGQAPYTNPSLSADSSQWGLWDWDVVEVFLAVDGSSTYYEFQVSPLNQYFELKIFEPRKRFDQAFSSGFRHVARLEAADAWFVEMHVPLAALGWDGQRSTLRGNAFAILGDPRLGRSYWSLSLPTQAKPDFHLPAHFVRFFSDKA